MLAANLHDHEIAQFESLAKDWWDLKGSSRSLHHLNPCRLNFIEQHCSLAGKQVLDIGCGGGILSESLAQAGAEVTGVDAAGLLINVATAHAEKNLLKINYYQATAESFSTDAIEQFDIITCMELLEHVPNPLSLLQACQKMLKPDGHLFISTLNRNLKSYLLAIVAAENILKLLPKATHHYSQFIRPSELAHGLQQAGFSLQLLRGMQYNPFTEKAVLSSDVSVNYLAYARRST